MLLPKNQGTYFFFALAFFFAAILFTPPFLGILSYHLRAVYNASYFFA